MIPPEELVAEAVVIDIRAAAELPVGATLVIGGLPIEGGSGSPARVLAFLPPVPPHRPH